MIQRKINLHCSLTLDLFGSEQSSNAATVFNAGLKGRFHEDRLADDHRLLDATYPVTERHNGGFGQVEVLALRALNARLRDDFIDDCAGGLRRFNREIADHGIDLELKLPHVAFNREIGQFGGLAVTPEGAIIDRATFGTNRAEWLPNPGDAEFILDLMSPEGVPGRFATWIAPPARGVNKKPLDFEYVWLPDRVLRVSLGVSKVNGCGLVILLA